jgi:AcrR family transcriptional regulator
MSEDVKTRILEAARKLFARQGYAGTSVRQICEEAGANVALVSYHFGGKEKLWLAIIEQFFQPDPQLLERFQRMEDPVERLKMFVWEFYRHVGKHRDVGMMIQHEMLLKSDRLPVMQEHAKPLWGLVRRTLAEGREMGRFRFRSLDRALLHVMGTLIFPSRPTLIAELLTEEPLSFEETVEECLQYMLRGLGADDHDVGEEG